MTGGLSLMFIDPTNSLISIQIMNYELYNNFNNSISIFNPE